MSACGHCPRVLWVANRTFRIDVQVGVLRQQHPLHFAHIDFARLAAIERWVGMQPDLDDIDEEIAQARGEKLPPLSQKDLLPTVPGQQ